MANFKVLDKWLSLSQGRFFSVVCAEARCIALAQVPCATGPGNAVYARGEDSETVYEAFASLDDALSSEAGKLLAAERTDPVDDGKDSSDIASVGFSKPKSG